jgi:hypothetical protein
MTASSGMQLDFPAGHPAADPMPSPPPSASSMTPPNTAAIVAGGGPLMGTHAVLPRPRPGRKPAADAPRTKRGEQNRAAQRNYRAREKLAKEELVRERDVLLAQVRRAREECAEAVRGRAQEREEMVARLRQIAAENERLRARVGEAEAERARAVDRVRELEDEVGGLRAAVQGMCRRSGESGADVGKGRGCSSNITWSCRSLSSSIAIPAITRRWARTWACTASAKERRPARSSRGRPSWHRFRSISLASS